MRIVMSTEHSPQQDSVQPPIAPATQKNGGKTDDLVSRFDIDYANYKLPRLTLLNEAGKKSRSSANLQAAKLKGRQLIDILEQFGVKATLVGTHIGPSITKFEVRPDLGVRVNKISNLQYDIKMALAAKDIRIEAPIPGKSAVGIEVPNEEKTTVHFKEMMRSIPQSMADSAAAVLSGNGSDGQCRLWRAQQDAASAGSRCHRQRKIRVHQFDHLHDLDACQTG